MRFSSALLLLSLLACATWTPSAQATTDADVNVALHEAELRKALAEADRAEWLARLPPSTAKPPAGAAETSRAGVAALMKSVDLAMQLAAELCAALPSASKVALYEPASTQGIVAARTVDDGLLHTSEQLARQLQQLQRLIERYTPPTGTSHQLAPLLALATVPATIKSAADISALFKSDVALTGIAYGEGARTLFATALFKACPRHVAGLGAGYLGELDPDVHAALLERVRALAALRGEFAQRIEAIDALADSAKGAEKRLLAHSASNAGAMLKTVDAFIESLKAGETGDKSPLYNAARFLAHAARTRDALLLDFDLRLDGVTFAKDGLFTGERVRVAGAAILWYRLHAPDGTLLQADALRRVSTPVELDLRAAEPFR